MVFIIPWIDVYIPHRRYPIKPQSSPWFSAACAAVIVHRNRCRRVLEVTKLAYANKTKESITSQKFGSQDFWLIANSVVNKVKSASPTLFNGPQVLSSASDKVKLLAENFSKNFNLDDSCISLPVFPSRANLKLHNISVTPKTVKRDILNLDLSKASGSDCLPGMVLKNCEPELSHILAEPCNECLKEACFPDCWKFSMLVPIFKNRKVYS